MKVICLGVCAAAALTMATPVLAQPVSQPAGPIGDISGFRGGPNALPRVIERAQDMTGGFVVEARYSRRDGKGGYDVLVSKGGQLDSIRLERFDSGAVQTIQLNARPDWMLKWMQRADIRIVRHAKVPLDEAVRTAEQSAGGPAVAAGVARGDASAAVDVRAYNVLIDLPDGRMRRVAVDANSGQIIADPNALSDWP